jgi:hypothetical protein
MWATAISAYKSQSGSKGCKAWQVSSRLMVRSALQRKEWYPEAPEAWFAEEMHQISSAFETAQTSIR